MSLIYVYTFIYVMGKVSDAEEEYICINIFCPILYDAKRHVEMTFCEYS